MTYPEQCSHCGHPARIETLSDERIGVEEYQYCSNIACPFYDIKQAELEQRERTLKVNRIATAPRRTLPLAANDTIEIPVRGVVDSNTGQITWNTKITAEFRKRSNELTLTNKA